MNGGNLMHFQMLLLTINKYKLIECALDKNKLFEASEFIFENHIKQ